MGAVLIWNKDLFEEDVVWMFTPTEAEWKTTLCTKQIMEHAECYSYLWLRVFGHELHSPTRPSHTQTNTQAKDLTLNIQRYLGRRNLDAQKSPLTSVKPCHSTKGSLLRFFLKNGSLEGYLGNPKW